MLLVFIVLYYIVLYCVWNSKWLQNMQQQKWRRSSVSNVPHWSAGWFHSDNTLQGTAETTSDWRGAGKACSLSTLDTYTVPQQTAATDLTIRKCAYLLFNFNKILLTWANSNPAVLYHILTHNSAQVYLQTLAERLKEMQVNKQTIKRNRNNKVNTIKSVSGNWFFFFFLAANS